MKLIILVILLSISSFGAPKILFVGSSTIARWETLRNDFLKYEVVNLGVSASTYQYTEFNIARQVKQNQPDGIVTYSGDNDLAFGFSEKFIVNRVLGLLEKIRASKPGVKVYIVSVKPSPARNSLLEKTISLNSRLTELAQSEGFKFIDIFHPMMGSDGKFNLSLYGPDKLHLSGDGYALWTQIIKPYLDRDFLSM